MAFNASVAMASEEVSFKVPVVAEFPDGFDGDSVTDSLLMLSAFMKVSSLLTQEVNNAINAGPRKPTDFKKSRRVMIKFHRLMYLL